MKGEFLCQIISKESYEELSERGEEMEKEQLLDLLKLYSNRMSKARENIEKYKGTQGEQEWLIQFYQARGKVELLGYLLKEIS